MPPKKHIIIIAVLSMISLGLGYWYGMPKEGSEQENAGNTEGKEETAAKEPEFLKKGIWPKKYLGRYRNPSRASNQ